jgi:hypothetical protein
MRLPALFPALALVAVLAAPVSASECPTHIARIDQALATAQLSPEQKARVQQLRDEGQKLHGEGRHQESLETLGQAEQILGI